MKWKILGMTMLVLLAAVVAPAEVEVTIADEPLELGKRSPSVLDRSAGLTVRSSSHNPNRAFILPHFRVDTVNPFGDTTLIAVRNEHLGANLVRVDLWDAPGDNIIGLRNTLSAKEVWTLNLRDWIDELPIDGDGYRRGYGVIKGEFLKDITVDWFQANPDENFAVGGVGVAIRIDLGSSHELCELWKIRSLIGGAFSGGTTVTIYRGGTSSCTITGNAYTEMGTFANSFEFSTGDDYSFTVDASELTTTSATSLEIDLSDCGPGWVGVVHDAEGRYSVAVDGICTE